MSWHTNRASIGLRNFARKAGLTRALGRIASRHGYEHAFERALFTSIRDNDVVWDVGANVGYYTRLFAEAVGPNGHVVAFEPFPATAERLRVNLKDIVNLTLCVKALGDEEATVTMEVGGDALGATNRIVEGVQEGVVIQVVTGDRILTEGSGPSPNIIKIDTEGFELDVLRGMTGLIGSSDLRAIFVEVHFALLVERGKPNAPSEIEQLLKRSGFAVRWVDASHIAATRG